MTDRNKIADDLRADFAQRIEELKAMRNTRDGFSDNHVLWLNGMGITFTVSLNGKCSKPQPCRIEDAYHLKASEAERLQSQFWDGNSKPAIAMTFANAVDLTIADTQEAIDTIDRLMADRG